MIKKIIYCLIFILLSSIYPAQKTDKEKEVDSLFHAVNLLGDANTNNKTEEVLKICTEIYYKAKEINYTDAQARALVYINSIYFQTGNIKLLLSKANEGIALVKDDKKYNTYHAYFLLEKSAALSRLGYFGRAEQNLKESLNILQKDNSGNNDEKNYVKALVYICFITLYEEDREISMNKKDKTFYLHKAFQTTQQISPGFVLKNSILTACFEQFALAYTEWGQYDEANKYIQRGNHINETQKSNWPQTRDFLLGKIEEKKKNYNKAVSYYEKSLLLAKEYKLIYEQERILPLVAECYHALKDHKRESYFLEKSKKLSDSMNLLKKNTLDFFAKEENSTPKNITTNLDFSIFYYMGLFLIAVILLYILLKYKVLRKRNKYTFSESEVLNNPPQNEPDVHLEYLTSLAQNEDTSFYFKFNEAFPDFSKKLQKINSKLTQSDLELCIMIKLGCDTKKMASIRKSSIGAIESRKYRIRKKLGIPKEENIHIWLLDK